MKIEIKLTNHFKKYTKKLQKKYRSIKNDIQKLITDLKENPSQGKNLGDGFYKIRLKNSDNKEGKRG